jgi:hypothetical protein
MSRIDAPSAARRDPVHERLGEPLPCPRLPCARRLLRRGVRLVQRDEHGRARLAERRLDPLLVPSRGRRRGIDHEQDDVGLGERLERRGEHRPLQKVARLEQTRCVEEDELDGTLGEDPGDALPRRLRLRRDDREVLADQPVQERRLARVGTADERDVPRAGRRRRRPAGMHPPKLPEGDANSRPGALLYS